MQNMNGDTLVKQGTETIVTEQQKNYHRNNKKLNKREDPVMAEGPAPQDANKRARTH